MKRDILGRREPGKKQCGFLIVYTKEAMPYTNYPYLGKRIENLKLPMVLMCKRYDGTMGFIGGEIEEGEEIVIGVIREVLEEINYIAKPENMKPLSTFTSSTHNIHSFIYEVSWEELQSIQKGAFSAPHFLAEHSGCFFQAIGEEEDSYTKKFLKNNFSGTSRREFILLKKLLYQRTAEEQAIIDNAPTSLERLFLENIIKKKWEKALKAYFLVKKEMCKEKGFVRQGGADYYIHCVEAAMTLINYGVDDEATIVAALLHDIVEDVPGWTVEKIRKLFGDIAAEVVELVSKKPDVDYKKPPNLIAYLKAICNNWRAALVKTADRMHNFSTLKSCTPEKKLKQANETEEYFFPFFKECRKLYPEYRHFFVAAKTQIRPHLDEIKEHYEELSRVKTELDKAVKELKELKANR